MRNVRIYIKNIGIYYRFTHSDTSTDMYEFGIDEAHGFTNLTTTDSTAELQLINAVLSYSEKKKSSVALQNSEPFMPLLYKILSKPRSCVVKNRGTYTLFPLRCSNTT